MKNGKLARATALFFALMLCFTILSRAADQLSVAVVQTERPQNQMIEHAVRASGRIVQNQDLAVTTLPDQRVMAIYVREGQRVAKGDLLFEIDTTLLEEQILNQQQEMEKQELQVKDVKSQKEVGAQQKANAQAQAAEQYSLTTRQAGVQLSRAKQQLAQAKQKLKKFQKSSGIKPKDSEVEDALLQALEDKTNAYVAAQGELRTLEWEIENAVYTAKQNALAGDSGSATLVAEDRNYTGAEDVILPEEDGSPADTADVTGAETGSDAEDPGLAPDEMGADEDFESVPEEMGADGDGIDLSIDIESPVDQNMDPDVGNMSVPDEGAVDMTGSELNAETGDVILSDTGAGDSPGEDGCVGEADTEDQILDDVLDQTSLRQITAEELAQIEQTVRAGYAQKLKSAQEKVSDAQAEKETSEKALMQYQQEQTATGNSENRQTAQQLAANVQAAQQAYEDAALAANEAAVTSGRAVQIANIGDPSNSSDRMNEITYEQMELTLEKLEGLKKVKGKVFAESDGLITKINIMTGEKTTDTTALLMADFSKGYRFTADITKEQQKYIGTGDLVKLTSGDGKQKLEDLPVESVAVDENDEGIYHVTVQIPEDTFEIGRTVNLDYSRKSGAYPVTVPLSALHLDNRQQPYVLIVEEYESIMGTELRARRVNVTVQEQNESYAAISEGVIGSDQEIIVQSDKAVDNGSRVRIG